MSRKRLLLIITTILCTLIISSSLALAVGGQQVKIPYVVSTGDWWTGIAITNNSGDQITDMKLYFTTDRGNSNSWGLRAVLPGPVIPGPIIPSPLVNYSTNLEEIAGYALLVDTIANLYTGDGTNTLPYDAGSLIFSHTGSEQFTITVYIGSPLGFAFQVFESTNTGL